MVSPSVPSGCPWWCHIDRQGRWASPLSLTRRLTRCSPLSFASASSCLYPCLTPRRLRKLAPVLHTERWPAVSNMAPDLREESRQVNETKRKVANYVSQLSAAVSGDSTRCASRDSRSLKVKKHKALPAKVTTLPKADKARNGRAPSASAPSARHQRATKPSPGRRRECGRRPVVRRGRGDMSSPGPSKRADTPLTKSDGTVDGCGSGWPAERCECQQRIPTTAPSGHGTTRGAPAGSCAEERPAQWAQAAGRQGQARRWQAGSGCRSSWGRQPWRLLRHIRRRAHDQRASQAHGASRALAVLRCARSLDSQPFTFICVQKTSRLRG